MTPRLVDRPRPAGGPEFAGSPEQVAEDLARLRDLGAEEVIVSVGAEDMGGLRMELDRLRAAAAEVAR